MSATVGGIAVPTRFAVPSGRAADVLRTLDDQGLGLARARVAARLGNPDPFALRNALVADPEATVVGCAGEPVTADRVNAALLNAGDDPALHGLFAGRRPGPKARAAAGRPATRFERPPLPALDLGALQRFSTKEIGDTEVATVRCLAPIPGGVALGSDYGLTLCRGGKFQPFPWPEGARRESRRVEAMTFHQGLLYVGTQQALVTWDFRGGAIVKKHGRDEEEGWDDLRSMLSAERLYTGWRTRFDGGEGLPETISLAEAEGVVYGGTVDGHLYVVDGGTIRSFADHKGRPIRHLAFADGALWVAALGKLHRFDGCDWSEVGPEATALCAGPGGRLFALAEGRLHVWDEALIPVPVPLERPWALTATPGALWIGGRESVWRLQLGR